MSAFSTVKAWFVKEEAAIQSKIEPFMGVAKADLAQLEANIRTHADALFTVLRAEFQKVAASVAAPAVPTPAPAAPPVAADLVAAKNAELDSAINAAAQQKAAIALAVDGLTKALTGIEAK